jgi:peptidoglycan hydrolase CwlO-like protein
MLQVIIFSSISLLVGFSTAWILRTIEIAKIKRINVGTEGLLESEKLIKETLRKESARAFQMKETVEAELGRKLQNAESIIKQMDKDILLLQKSNEETEKLLQTTEPELYNLKVKLLEANNTISRLKGQLQSVSKD